MCSSVLVHQKEDISSSCWRGSMISKALHFLTHVLSLSVSPLLFLPPPPLFPFPSEIPAGASKSACVCVCTYTLTNDYWASCRVMCSQLLLTFSQNTSLGWMVVDSSFKAPEMSTWSISAWVQLSIGVPDRQSLASAWTWEFAWVEITKEFYGCWMKTKENEIIWRKCLTKTFYCGGNDTCSFVSV